MHGAHQSAHLLPLVIIEGMPPTDAGGVVVGTGVNEPVAALIVGRQVRVIWIAVESKLQDFHAWQAETIAQGFHIRCNDAEILRNQRQRPGAGTPCASAQQRLPWRWFPATTFG
jgi:hypothetical protein